MKPREQPNIDTEADEIRSIVSTETSTTGLSRDTNPGRATGEERKGTIRLVTMPYSEQNPLGCMMLARSIGSNTILLLYRSARKT